MAQTVRGYANPPFEEIVDIFKDNFEKGYERAGAAFAVVHEGRLIIDLYGGYANLADKEVWGPETCTVIFSVTKSLTSMVLALLVDRGLVNYDDLVSKHWPAFAKCGKESVTVNHILQHRSGVLYGDRVLSAEEVMNPSTMSTILEEMVPLWKPGTQSAYHALTFGFLVDQIVRRVDPKKRGVEQIFREDIMNKYGQCEVFIGLQNDEMNANVAKIEDMTEESCKNEKMYNPEGVKKALAAGMQYWDELYRTWPWITLLDYNRLENRRRAMPSNMGIATARGVALVHSLIAEGNIFSLKMQKMIEKPQVIDDMDIVDGFPQSRGYGWRYFMNKMGNWNLGHTGCGGQNVRVDQKMRLSYAYLCNGMTASDGDDVMSFQRLQNKLYDILMRNCDKEEKNLQE